MSSEKPVPTEVNVNTGTAGIITAGGKILQAMATEKMLTIFVAGAFGWLLFTTFQTASQDKVQSQRMYDDSRERDRQHCDSREDKIARDRDAELQKMREDRAAEFQKSREWYAAQAEVQRKFEADQREKDRAPVAKLTEQVMELTRQVSRLKDKNDNDDVSVP